MSLSYDANGNLLADEAGRQLDHDALSRLVKVTPTDGSVALDYGYDAVDILRSSANEKRFYCAGQLSNLVESNAGSRYVLSIVRAGGRATAGRASGRCVATQDRQGRGLQTQA